MFQEQEKSYFEITNDKIPARGRQANVK